MQPSWTSITVRLTPTQLTAGWTRAQRVSCQCCRAVSTSCYTAVPEVTVCVIQDNVSLELTMGSCERCDFMGSHCRLDGAAMEIVGLWTDSCRGHWHADNVFVERGGYRYSEAADAHLPSKSRRKFSAAQKQLLSDLFDAAERLQRVKE